MLGDFDPLATIPVKDLEAARKFYEETLGLKHVQDGGPGVLVCKAGRSDVLSYESPNARTNKATTITWDVGRDIGKITDDLQQKGVEFLTYENLPHDRMDGPIHVVGDFKLAWFKDLDGNIIHIYGQ